LHNIPYKEVIKKTPAKKTATNTTSKTTKKVQN